jgi:hypothetical protein
VPQAWRDGVRDVGAHHPVPAAGGPIGVVNLHHGDVVLAQMPGERGAVATVAFHPDTTQQAEAARPGQQLPVAGRGGRERDGGYQHAEDRDHRSDKGVLVRFDTGDDFLGGPAVVAVLDCVRHAGHWLFVS